MSNNEILEVNLKDLPHLFVSYSEEDQIQQFFQKLSFDFSNNRDSISIQFSIALKIITFECVRANIHPELLPISYLIKDNNESLTVSKFQFWQNILKELKKRERQYNNSPEKFLSKSHPMIILIEDVFDMVITHRKFTNFYFLQILV